MKTSKSLPSVTSVPERLRLHLWDTASPDRVDGAWWPRSRDLQREVAELVDHFPAAKGHISRLLFSRPDWDNSSRDGHGVRSIRAARGQVKVGSFPSDDNHVMILSMVGGRRLKVLVIPSDTPSAEGRRLLRAVASTETSPEGAADWARWDNESPGI
jgi:hypothetical protein